MAGAVTKCNQAVFAPLNPEAKFPLVRQSYRHWPNLPNKLNSMNAPESAIGGERTAVASVTEERRRTRRAKISKPVRTRPSDPKYQGEVRTTSDASRDGLYFTTWAEHYHVGMSLSVIFPYASVDLGNGESAGRIVRIDRLTDGRFGIAVQILLR